MEEISKDIWFARNQPYGSWRVGNPIVKSLAIFLMATGIIIRDHGLVFQSVSLVFLMLFLPFNYKNKILLVLINLGLGGFIVSLTYPGLLIDYSKINISIPIPHVASIELLNVVAVISIVISLLVVTKAITSRDYAWLASIVPRRAKPKTSGYIHSFAYAFIRMPDILSEAKLSLLSRGYYPPYSFKQTTKRFDSLGLSMLYLARELKEMVITIEYSIISRIKPSSRQTPVAKHFSLTDLSFLGIIIFGIFVPRIVNLLK